MSQKRRSWPTPKGRNLWLGFPGFRVIQLRPSPRPYANGIRSGDTFTPPISTNFVKEPNVVLHLLSLWDFDLILNPFLTDRSSRCQTSPPPQSRRPSLVWLGRYAFEDR